LELLDDCREELSTLPIPVTNEPSAEILLRITKFCGDFHSAVYGDSHKELAQANRGQYAEFKRAIRNTAPDFRPFDDSASYTKPLFPDEEAADNSPNPAIKPLDLSDVRRVIKK
jgi:vacuolar protein sorting-associated protein 1